MYKESKIYFITLQRCFQYYIIYAASIYTLLQSLFQSTTSIYTLLLYSVCSHVGMNETWF